MTFANPYPGDSARARPPAPTGPPPPEVFTPERLARERAADQPAPTTAPGTPTPAAPSTTDAARVRQVSRDDPLSGLEALNPGARPRPLLPPADTLDDYDPTLAAMLRAVADAYRESVADALDARNARYGGVGWQAALQATTTALFDHLDDCPDPGGDTLPPLPPAASTALRRHIVDTAPDLLVNAYQSQARAAWADRRARDHARHADQTLARVRQARDALEADIAARWATARDSHDRSEYEAGKRLSPQWAQANAVAGWLANPDLAYTPPRPARGPGDLEYLEYQTDMATGGLERNVPPIPPADKQALERHYGGGNR